MTEQEFHAEVQIYIGPYLLTKMYPINKQYQYQYLYWYKYREHPYIIFISHLQFLSDRIEKAARSVYNVMIERNPGLIRDRKYHLKTHRQCSSGKELVDWLMKQNECLQSRSQAVGIWQVLVDEGILIHGKRRRFVESEVQTEIIYIVVLFTTSQLVAKNARQEINIISLLIVGLIREILVFLIYADFTAPDNAD